MRLFGEFPTGRRLSTFNFLSELHNRVVTLDALGVHLLLKSANV
jgi:hypothetical protein